MKKSKAFSNTTFDLSGKIALITGAAGLLGKEHSIALIESGAKVIMTDINQVKLIKTAKQVENLTGFKPLIEKMDVTNYKSIKKLNKKLKKQNLFVTILINNAALNPKVVSNKNKNLLNRLENFDIDLFKKEYEIGLLGYLLCSIEFGNEMSKKKGGVIINIASDLSVISPDQRLYRKSKTKESQQPVKPISYSIIKSGIIGLTKYLSTYWAKENVRSNALSPGGIYDRHEKEFVKKLTNLIPLGRMAEKKEYRGAIQFLCSDASKYLNGQNIIIDGGRSVW